MASTPTVSPDCPFCRSNGLLKGDILAESSNAYLIRNHLRPECYLIIPAQHAETLTDLPDNWWVDAKDMLRHIPDMPADYNFSLNYGAQAGQSVKHLHFWVIPRVGGQPASGKGLAYLVDMVNQA